MLVALCAVPIERMLEPLKNLSRDLFSLRADNELQERVGKRNDERQNEKLV